MVSKKVLEQVFGFSGFRFGVSPDGRKYWSLAFTEQDCITLNIIDNGKSN
jgi:hypothetical protein